VDAEELEAAGLYDPDAPGAEQRLELLEYLTSIGATDEQLRDAAAADDALYALLDLAAPLALHRDGNRLTVDEAAARAGIEPALARRVRLAAGLPDPGPGEACWPEEVDVLRSVRVGAELFGQEPMIEFIRMLGSSSAAVAESALAIFGAHGAPASGRARTPTEIARSAYSATRALTGIPVMFGVLLLVHFELARLRAITAGSRQLAPGTSVAIVFVDLESSTPLVRQLDLAELADVMADFERVAIEAAVAIDGRVVKMIGDAAMLVTPDPEAAVDGALAIVRAIDAHPVLDAARAAVSYGPVVPRDGDYFGAVVNVAARLVAEAEPGEVLMTSEVASALPDDVVEPRGHRHLRGFDEPVTVYAHRDHERAP
jgi:class 3 adenylate cyclase